MSMYALQHVLRKSNNFQCLFRSLSNAPRSLVSVTRDEKSRTATVILQRPPVNSLNTELLQEITSSIRDLEKDKYKGFILTSSSPTVFSGGLDIMEMYQTNEERLRTFWRTLQEMWCTLYLTPMYTVAAVNGHSPAGGCMLSLSCDYSIMINSNATIGLNEIKLGIVAPVWFQKLYVDAMGFRNAAKALDLGTLFTPQEALSLNIVDELADDSAQVLEKAKKRLEAAVQISAFARSTTKYKMRSPRVQELKSYADAEVEEILKFVFSDVVQKTLGVYISNLKQKKSK